MDTPQHTKPPISTFNACAIGFAVFSFLSFWLGLFLNQFGLFYSPLLDFLDTFF